LQHVGDKCCAQAKESRLLIGSPDFELAITQTPLLAIIVWPTCINLEQPLRVNVGSPLACP
jgi:hypothetical protein